jgi:glycosyltransferase involved in cell wall biosynthesis
MQQTYLHPGLFKPLNGTVEKSNNPKVGSSAHPFYNQMLNKPKVSVIIPTLNEAQNLPLVLPYLPMEWIDEVILVDGRSTDGTVEVATALLPSIKVIMEKKRGKGAALVAGYRAATGDILIVVDADGSNDPREIPRFIGALMEGADMVKGSRFATGGGTNDMPLLRKLGNQFFVLSVNLMFGSHWSDLCYGYHAFWRHCLDHLDMSDVPGFEIDAALYLRAVREQFHILEVPSFEGYRFFGDGKLQTFPDGWRVLKTIFKEWKQLKTHVPEKPYIGFRGPCPTPSHFNGQADLSSVYLNQQLLKIIALFMEAGYNVNHLLGRILEIALNSTEAMSGSIFVVDQQGELHDGCLAFENQLLTLKDSGYGEILGQGLAGWAVKNLQPALVSNTCEDPRWLERHWDEKASLPRSALAIPLLLNHQHMCVLTLVRSQENQFTSADLEPFNLLSVQD